MPRHVVCKNYTEIQLHGFADASQRAYGACVYIRSQNPEGVVEVKLLCAKARMAPLKQQTIPRLELCAALTLVHLVAKVVKSLRINVNEITCWSDSVIVISWLRMQPSALQTFVANWVSEIQRLTESSQWKHRRIQSISSRVVYQRKN